MDSNGCALHERYHQWAYHVCFLQSKIREVSIIACNKPFEIDIIQGIFSTEGFEFETTMNKTLKMLRMSLHPWKYTSIALILLPLMLGSFLYSFKGSSENSEIIRIAFRVWSVDHKAIREPNDLTTADTILLVTDCCFGPQKNAYSKLYATQPTKHLTQGCDSFSHSYPTFTVAYTNWPTWHD